ncbi:Gfo/Idh/MocA family oxidoreductase [Candidatus Woesearchaeota archaeon]|nr:Gfo/Idh/MocA family oxidoreductase [Candidatus Woesearchaeota archaeon]
MVNIGVIGCGYWGPNLVRNFSQINECNVAWCSDLREERLNHIKGLYPKIKTTKNYLDIIKDRNVDAVAIATPVSVHFEQAKAALENNKHVLVEKPLTSSSEHAKELIKIAEKNKKALMVDHTFEYTSAVGKIKELIEKEELGKIFTIDMIRVNLGLFQKDINVVWDLAPHDISILLFLMGKMPLSVRAEGMDFVQKGIEDDVHLTLKFPENIMAYMHVSWLDPLKIRKMTIVGNKKMLVYDDTEQTEKIKVYDKGVALEKSSLPKDRYYDTWEEFKLVYRSGDVLIPKLDSKEPLNAMCGHFIDCIKNGKKPVSDGYSGLRVIQVIEAMQKSLKSKGREIFLQRKPI